MFDVPPLKIDRRKTTPAGTKFVTDGRSGTGARRYTPRWLYECTTREDRPDREQFEGD